jgi:hypothetical protein
MIAITTNTHRVFIIAEATAMAADVESVVIDFRDMPLGSVQVVWENADSTDGEFKLYASNFSEANTFTEDNAIPLSDFVVTSPSGSKLWSYERLAFRYMMLKWKSNGTSTGTMKAIAIGKKT